MVPASLEKTIQLQAKPAKTSTSSRKWVRENIIENRAPLALPPGKDIPPTAIQDRFVSLKRRMKEFLIAKKSYLVLPAIVDEPKIIEALGKRMAWADARRSRARHRKMRAIVAQDLPHFLEKKVAVLCFPDYYFEDAEVRRFWITALADYLYPELPDLKSRLCMLVLRDFDSFGLGKMLDKFYGHTVYNAIADVDPSIMPYDRQRITRGWVDGYMDESGAQFSDAAHCGKDTRLLYRISTTERLKKTAAFVRPRELLAILSKRKGWEEEAFADRLVFYAADKKEFFEKARLNGIKPGHEWAWKISLLHGKAGEKVACVSGKIYVITRLGKWLVLHEDRSEVRERIVLRMAKTKMHEPGFLSRAERRLVNEINSVLNSDDAYLCLSWKHSNPGEWNAYFKIEERATREVLARENLGKRIPDFYEALLEYGELGDSIRKQ